jgi:hypothetical protein
MKGNTLMKNAYWVLTLLTLTGCYKFQANEAVVVSGKVTDSRGAPVKLDSKKDNRICISADFLAPSGERFSASDCPSVMTDMEGRYSVTALLTIRNDYGPSATFELVKSTFKIGVMRTGYDQPFNDKAVGQVKGYRPETKEAEVDFILDHP